MIDALPIIGRHPWQAVMERVERYGYVCADIDMRSWEADPRAGSGKHTHEGAGKSFKEFRAQRRRVWAEQGGIGRDWGLKNS